VKAASLDRSFGSLRNLSGRFLVHAVGVEGASRLRTSSAETTDVRAEFGVGEAFGPASTGGRELSRWAIRRGMRVPETMVEEKTSQSSFLRPPRKPVPAIRRSAALRRVG